MINTNLKKIIILTYFFPPSNFAGSFRVASWAKYLHEFGYYPIVITRHWEVNQSDFSGICNKSEIVIKKEVGFEIHYLPYKGNLRDRLIKYGKTLSLLRKALSLTEILLQHFTNSVIPYCNLFSYSEKMIKNNNDIKLLISSGRPFILFKFGYLLKKKYDIKWIADYRDEWTSSQWSKYLSFSNKVIVKVEKFFEKKYIKNAEFITSVSELWTSNISTHVNKRGFVIMNGYDEYDYIHNESDTFKEFTITYNGTLYKTQNIEIFLRGLIMIFNKYIKTIKIRIYFPGLEIDKYASVQVRKILKGYERNFLITNRITKKEVIRNQFQSHILLMVGHTGIKGTHSSKIFEYLACHKPIILCPSDNDVLENLILKTNAGFICNTEHEVVTVLDKLIMEYIQSQEIKHQPNYSEIEKYTRRNQTKIFASIIDKI